MEQHITLNVHFLEFKRVSKSSTEQFKLRFSLLEEAIPEEKMIKGTQPLAQYHPREFQFSNPVFSDSHASPNQILSFRLSRAYDPTLDSEALGERRAKQSADLVVELFLKTAPGSRLAKAFPMDADGFVNIGHNMLRVQRLGRGLHESVRLVFDEVLFCSAEVALHIQTSDFTLNSGKASKRSKPLSANVEN